MNIRFLNKESLRTLVSFEKEARETEPGVLFGNFDEGEFYDKTLKALKDKSFSNAKTILCFQGEKVVGRLDFSIISSFAFGGDKQLYVDWIYVLKEYRHKKIAQALFEEVEKYMKENNMDRYFLIAAENDEAKRLYHNMKDVKITRQEILEKQI